MKRTLRAVACLVFGMGAGAAQALPIVTVGTQEWLQPKDFLNVSWNDIAGVCSAIDGVCSNALLGTTNMDGWTWASNEEMGAFFTSVAGIPNGDGALGAYLPLFTALGFEVTGTLFDDVGGIALVTLNGWTRTVNPGGDAGFPVYARVTSYYVFEGDSIERLQTLGFEGQRDRGGWFFRAASPAEVPGPATLPLVGLSLLALGYSRRCRKKTA